MKQRYLGLLSAGHFFTDFNQGALPAILPFLISEHHLSYAAAASLVFALSFVSSLVQPLFGYLADRSPMPWLLPTGVFLAGLGLACIGFLHSYWLLFLAVTVSGIGVAAFHPEAARLANQVSGEKKGTGVSIFTVGGNAGYAAGPVLTISALLLWGLEGTLAILIPIGLMTLFFCFEAKNLRQFHPKPSVSKQTQGAKEAGSAPDEWGAFARLTVVIFSRSMVFYGLTTFIPLYWISAFGQSNATAGTALTIFLFTGAVGTLVGGRLADRYGFRQIIRLGFAALVPIIALFVNVTDVTLATVLLIPLGLAMYIPFSPVVVLAQKYLPNRMGLASGVSLGLAVSIGGITTPFFGRLADTHGLAFTLTLVACIPVLTALAAFVLPPPGQGARPKMTDAGAPAK